MKESEPLILKPVARIRNDFKEKFGIPRQSGLVPELLSVVVFEPEYRRTEALTGIEGYDYLWLIWEFSENRRDSWSPTVRPPRLGGNERMGVFATRSPFRPNPLGLSCVRLHKVRKSAGLGSVLIIGGADLMDGTPIYDIKPYLPHLEAHPEAASGFAGPAAAHRLYVMIPEEVLACFTREQQSAVCKLLSQDPRPAYQNDPERIYGMTFGERNIRFRVEGDTLYVLDACICYS